MFKGFVEQLSQEKHREKEFKLMSDVERIAAGLIAKERKIYKGVSANVLTTPAPTSPSSPVRTATRPT